MIKLKIDINQHSTQLEQMASFLKLRPNDNRLNIPARLGTGFLQYYELPYNIQLHHYRYKLKHQIEVNGQNNLEDGLYMININLSNRILNKNVGDSPVKLSQSGGSGTLFYSPGYHSRGKNELNVEYEVIFFAFPKSTLQMISTSSYIKDLGEMEKFCIYDELIEVSDQQLRLWLNQSIKQKNQLVFKGALLQILGQIIDQFTHRSVIPSPKLNIRDVERQFMVKETLLKHLFGQPPKINQLAELVHISPSKLKSDFKSVFGKSVYQYYLAKKMEIAKELIIKKEGTISEIGHQLGYSNISQFSSQFKKHFGLTPSTLLK